MMEKKKVVGMLVIVLLSMVGVCWAWGWQEMTKETVKDSLSDSGLDNFLVVMGQKFENAREAAKDMMDKGGDGASMSASDSNQVDNGRETMAYGEDNAYDGARHEAHHAEEKVADDEAHHAKDEIADAKEHGTDKAADTIDVAKEPLAEANQNARDKAIDAYKKGSQETKEAVNHGSSADRIFSEDAMAKFEAWKEKAYHVISNYVAWTMIKVVLSHGKDEAKACDLVSDDVARIIDKAAAHAYNEIGGYTYASGDKIVSEDLMAKFGDKIMGEDVMAKFEALTEKASHIIADGVARILKGKAAESISRGRNEVSHVYNEVEETYVSGDKITSEDVIAKFEALTETVCHVIANDVARIIKDKAAELISHGDEVSHATYASGDKIMSEELKPNFKAWEKKAANAIGDDVAIKHKAAESTSHGRNEVSDAYNEAINKVGGTYVSADKIMSKDVMDKFEAAMEQASHALGGAVGVIEGEEAESISHGREEDSNAYDEAKNELGETYAAADKILSMDAMAKYEAAKEKASQAMGDVGAKMRANIAEV
ncbi:hypothetical protein ES288_D12G072200v1 [Gossypium darwinii]|uniref:Uncharacterized protein n=2 Tax=Gossypium TaxID=3633 RepID=A0A5D2I6W0_GOSTO|nr:hypothetical protein ES288_D12G072200v1 [Gossypium darwinii]TYH37900.1 hypothetical protein ES332_D12G072800v1 [Gossypium tomentosum]